MIWDPQLQRILWKLTNVSWIRVPHFMPLSSKLPNLSLYYSMQEYIPYKCCLFGNCKEYLGMTNTIICKFAKAKIFCWPFFIRLLIKIRTILVSPYNYLQLKKAYHKVFLILIHFWAELQIGGNGHCLLDRQVAVQLVVLHNVCAQFAELADISVFSINFDATIFDICSSKKK